MRFSKIALVLSATAFVACGGEKAPEPPPAQPATPPAAAPAGPPITGTTKVVNMIVDAAGAFKFEPLEITVAPGDGIRFESVSGAPHNVAFDPAALPPAAKAVFATNMQFQEMGELSSKLLNNGESYTLSFANVPPGTYEVLCTPHIAMGMRMKVIVQ